MATYTVDKIEYNSNVYVLQDSGALQLTGGSVTGPVTFGDTITVDDATLGTMVVNGHASFTNGISGDLVGNVTGNVTGTASGNLTSSSTLNAAKLSGAIPSAVTATTQSSSDNSTKIATTAYVTTAITNLPEPMIFKGSVGTGGTITSLPAAAAANEGYTYKVITALTTPVTAKVGDTVISNGSAWTVIPSGDEPSGTVTSIAAGTGLNTTSNDTATDGGTITSSGTLYLTKSGATAGSYGPSANAEPGYGSTFNVPYLTVDKYGRVTAVSTKTVKIPASDNTNTTYTLSGALSSHKFTTTLTPSSGSATTSDFTLAAGTGITVTDDTTNRKMTIACSVTNTNTTYTLTNALASHKFTWTFTAGGSGSGSTTTTAELVQGTGMTLTDDTTNKKITIANAGVTSITTTAGAHTTKSSATGAVSFNVPTKTSHLTNDSGFLTSHQTLYEANLNWGGKDFSASYGCIDAAMIDVLGANRFAFLKAAGLTVEYSTNGGSTWTDYGATDVQKVGLFSNGYSFYLGKHTTAGTNTVNDMLRVTISTSAAGIYTVLNKIAIYMSTSGNTVQVLIERALESTPTTYATHKDWTGISGWSGWNILNMGGLTTYGNTASSQYGRVRFTFKQTAVNTNYSSASISKIMGFGGVGWSTPSYMAASGHLYAYDASQNATFPGSIYPSTNNSFTLGSSSYKWNNIYATTFTGDLTGTATNASKVNNLTVQTAVPANAVFTDSTVSTLTLASGSTAGTALSHGGKYTLTAGTKTVSFTMPSAPSVPTSAASATTGITASTTATKTTLGTAFSIPNVTSAGSASTWTFEKKTIPNVTSAGSASTWAFSSVTVANSISGEVNNSDSTQLDITLGTTSVQSKSSGSNGTAPTLGTAIEVYSKSGGGNGSAPTLGTAFSVPNVTGNTSATVSITDNGHTHTLS